LFVRPDARWLFLLPALLLPVRDAGARPWAEGSCIGCHAEEEDEELAAPVAEWRESIHAAHEVSCDACHGGDPREEDPDLAMSEEAGFLETPGWTDAHGFCGVCHEDIAKHYEQGRLGRQLGDGFYVASCTTCHMAEGHRIVAARPAHLDPRCADCEPFAREESLRAAKDSLQRVRREEDRLLATLARAEGKGMDLGDLRDRYRRRLAGFRTGVHRFEAPAIAQSAVETLTVVDDLTTQAKGYEALADDRRRYGAALLALLGALFVGLLAVQRRMNRSREPGVEG